MSARSFTYCLLVLFCALGMAGKMEADIEQEIANERAPIYSKKCERQGKQILASRADNGPWKVDCVNSAVRM